jgi:hypothetical protein
MNRTLSLIVTFSAVIIIASVLVTHPNESGLTCLALEEADVVDKAQGETFTVRITLKNVGKTEGTWSVNVAFEGEDWSWSGTPKTLTLKQCHKKALAWTGDVPSDSQVDTVARLIVYYDDSFVPQDWWIHVTEAAELTITSSSVE